MLQPTDNGKEGQLKQCKTDQRTVNQRLSWLEWGGRKTLKQGRHHAGGYFVWDVQCTYYLLSGCGPDLGNRGTTNLFLWHAIKEAQP